MQTCAACGGTIGEPDTGSIQGVWRCRCPHPIPNDYPKVSGMQPGSIKDLVGVTFTEKPAPEKSPSPAEFVFWLRGYFAAGGPHTHTQGDWKRIAEELAKVKP